MVILSFVLVVSFGYSTRIVSFGAGCPFCHERRWLASATRRRFSCFFHCCKGRWGFPKQNTVFLGWGTVGKWKDSNSIRKLMGEMFLRKDFPWTWPKSNGCELYDNVYIHVCIYSVYIYIFTFINRKDIVPQSAAVFFPLPYREIAREARPNCTSMYLPPKTMNNKCLSSHKYGLKNLNM